VLLVVGLSIGAFGGKEGIPWCFWSSEATSPTEWALFYYPVLFIVLGGSFCMCSTIWRVVRSTRYTGRQRGWWRAQVRPATFVAVFLFIFAWVFIYRAQLFFEADAIEKSARDWIACTLMHATGTSGSRAERACGSKPSHHPSLALWFLFQTAVAGQGLLNSIIFGTQRANLDLWINFFRGGGVGVAGQPLVPPGGHGAGGGGGGAHSNAGSSDGGLTSGSSTPLAGAARMKPGRLLDDDRYAAADEGVYGYGYGAGSSNPGSWRGGVGVGSVRDSRAGSYQAPSAYATFERDEMSGSFVTLPPAVTGMMADFGQHHSPSSSSGGGGGIGGLIGGSGGGGGALPSSNSFGAGVGSAPRSPRSRSPATGGTRTPKGALASSSHQRTASSRAPHPAAAAPLSAAAMPPPPELAASSSTAPPHPEQQPSQQQQ
jgi:hypothetical protein